MLQHVAKVEVLDQVARGVNVIVRVLEVRLNHESRGIACFGGRGMIGTSITALGEDEGNGAVLC